MHRTILSAFTVFLIVACGREPPPTGPETKLPEARSLSPEDILAAKWIYETDIDPMDGRATVSASILSENAVTLSPPYDGPTRATLVLGQQPKLNRHPGTFGFVLFVIELGQLLCSSYSGCDIRVKFDQEDPRTFEVTPPSDGSTQSLRLYISEDACDFMERVSKSQTVRIQPTVHQSGSPVFEFRGGGVDLKRIPGEPDAEGKWWCPRRPQPPLVSP